MFDEIQDPRGVADRAPKCGFALVAFEKFNGEQQYGNIVRVQSHHALRVVGRADVVLQLETGFDKGPIDPRAAWVIGIFLQEAFEITHESGAIASGIVEGALQFLFGAWLPSGSLVFGPASAGRLRSSSLGQPKLLTKACPRRGSQRAEKQRRKSRGEGLRGHAGILSSQ